MSLLAEFERSDDVVHAAQAAWQAGYRKLDGFSPYPLPDLADAVGHPTSRLPYLIFAFGVLGACTGFFMCWYSDVVSLPLNVGGRPWGSTPAYIPITFELTVLFASLACIISMIIANRLPRLNHPLFGVPGFERASIDRFFLYIESGDPIYDGDRTRAFLQSFEPVAVREVPE
ncbi:MAG TPA: DUF3341 domain-containing protein [Candidatus Xenobia bacterium]|jgi:hypothetical protein